jgi:hypothetical protein
MGRMKISFDSRIFIKALLSHKIIMITQKAFEADLFAKQHYRKLLTAKSSLSKLAHR